jgi:hypothetical protein
MVGLDPIVVGNRQEAAEPRTNRADVIDEDVEPTEGRDRFLDQSRRAIYRTQVHGCRMDRIARSELRQIAIRGAGAGDDPRAFLGESLGDRQADTFTRARDDRDLAGQM